MRGFVSAAINRTLAAHSSPLDTVRRRRHESIPVYNVSVNRTNSVPPGSRGTTVGPPYINRVVTLPVDKVVLLKKAYKMSSFLSQQEEERKRQLQLSLDGIKVMLYNKPDLYNNVMDLYNNVTMTAPLDDDDVANVLAHSSARRAATTTLRPNYTNVGPHQNIVNPVVDRTLTPQGHNNNATLSVDASTTANKNEDLKLSFDFDNLSLSSEDVMFTESLPYLYRNKNSNNNNLYVNAASCSGVRAPPGLEMNRRRFNHHHHQQQQQPPLYKRRSVMQPTIDETITTSNNGVNVLSLEGVTTQSQPLRSVQNNRGTLRSVEESNTGGTERGTVSYTGNIRTPLEEFARLEGTTPSEFAVIPRTVVVANPDVALPPGQYVIHDEPNTIYVAYRGQEADGALYTAYRVQEPNTILYRAVPSGSTSTGRVSSSYASVVKSLSSEVNNYSQLYSVQNTTAALPSTTTAEGLRKLNNNSSSSKANFGLLSTLQKAKNNRPAVAGTRQVTMYGGNASVGLPLLPHQTETLYTQPAVPSDVNETYTTTGAAALPEDCEGGAAAAFATLSRSSLPAVVNDNIPALELNNSSYTRSAIPSTSKVHSGSSPARVPQYMVQYLNPATGDSNNNNNNDLTNTVSLSPAAAASRKLQSSLLYLQEDYCRFCRNNKESPDYYKSHVLKDQNGNVTCPVLFNYVCTYCGATGKVAHTDSHCSRNPKRGFSTYKMNPW